MPGQSFAQQYNRVKLEVQAQGAVASTKQLNKAFDMTYEKMQKQITSSGYLLLSLKRIATYTTIFSFFGGLARLVSGAIETERRFAEVSTLVANSNKDLVASLQRVTAELSQLDPHLGSTADLAKGLYEIMSAGYQDPAEGMEILKVAAEYAKGGMTDLGTSAAALTSVLKAYGKGADEARTVSDVLFQSVMEGKYHVEELNGALGNVLPTASIMGVSIEEVGAALATLSNRGLSANESATALNRMLLSFLKPGRGAVEVFRKLGIEYGINALKARGLGGALEDLRRAMVSGDQNIQKIIQRESGLRATFVLAQNGYEEYIDTLGREQKAMEGMGTTHEAFQKIAQTTSEEIKAMWVSFQQAMNTQMKYKGELNTVIKAMNWFGTNAVLNIKQLGAMAIGWAAVRTALVSTTNRFTAHNNVIDANSGVIAGNNALMGTAEKRLGTERIAMASNYQVMIDGTKNKRTQMKLYREFDKEYAKLPQKYADESKALHANNAAMMASNATRQTSIIRLQKWMGALSAALMVIQVVIIAYQLLNSAINSWKAALDRSMEAMVQSSNAIANKRKELKLLIAAQKEATGEEIKYSDMVYRAQQVAILATIEKLKKLNFKQVLAVYRKAAESGYMTQPLTESLGEKYGIGNKNLYQEDRVALKAFIDTLLKGLPVQDDYRDVLLAIARDTGEFAKAQAAINSEMKEGVDLLKNYTLVGIRASRMFEQFRSPSMGETTAETIMATIPKDEIKAMIDVFTELDKILSSKGDTDLAKGKYNEVVEAIGGLEQVEIYTKSIKDNMEVWKAAFAGWDTAAFRRKVEEWTNSMQTGIEKVTMSAETVRTVVAGLPNVWKIWQEVTGGADKSAFANFSEMSDVLEQLQNVWPKFAESVKKSAPETYKLIMELFSAMDKDKEIKKQEKIYEDYYAWIRDELVKGAGEIASLQKKADDDKIGAQWETAKAAFKITENELNDRLKKLLDSGKLETKAIELDLLRRKQIIAEGYAKFNAIVVAGLEKWIQEEYTSIKSGNDSWLERLDIIKKVSQDMNRAMKELGIDTASLSEEQLEMIRKIWNKKWGEITDEAKKKIDDLDYLKRIFSSFGRLFSTLASGLREVADAFGIQGAAVTKVIDLFEGLSKAAEMAVTAIDTLQAIEEAGTYMSDFAKGISKAAATLNIVAAAIVVVGTLFRFIFGKSKAQKEAERFQKLIKQIQIDLGSLGEVSASVAEDIATLSKKIGMTNAVLFNLGKLISDTGLSLANFSVYVTKLIQLFPKINQMSRYYKDQIEAANTAVSEMITYLQDMGQEGTRAFLNVIEAARKTGQTIKALDDYIFGWLEKGIDGIKKFIAGIDLSSITGGLDDPNGLFNKINKQIEDFGNSAKTIGSYFDDSFGNLLTLVKDLGLEGDKAFVGLITKVRLLGLNLAQVNDYVYGMLTEGVGGLDKMIARINFGPLEETYTAMKKNEEELKKVQDELLVAMQTFEPVSKIQEKIDELTLAISTAKFEIGSMSDEMKAKFLPTMERAGFLILQTFNAFISQGKSASEAFESIIGPLSALREKYAMLGVEADDALTMLFRLADLYKINEGMIASIDGVRQVLAALGNTGFLTADSLQAVAADAADMFDQLQGAGLSQKEALMFIAPTLADMVYYAEQYGFQLDAATLALIEQAKELGVYKDRQLSLSESMAEGFNSVVDALDRILDSLRGVYGSITEFVNGIEIPANLDTMREQLAELYGPQLERAGKMMLALFNSLIAQGKDYFEALMMIKEPLTDLREKYKLLGLTGSEALEQLFSIVDVEEKYAGLIDSLDGMRQVLLALGNTKFLSEDMLNEAGYQASEFYNTLVAGGIDSKQALAMLSPMLADIVYFAAQYGYNIDTATLALIEQAKAAGVYQERQRTLLEMLEWGFTSLNAVLVGLPDAMGRVWRSIQDGSFVAGHAWDGFIATGDAAVETANRVGIALAQMPTMDYELGAPPIITARRGLPEVGNTQLIRAHEGESILPKNLSDALRGFFGGTRPLGSGKSDSGMAEVTIQIDGMRFYKAVAPYIKTGMKNIDIETSGEGVF